MKRILSLILALASFSSFAVVRVVGDILLDKEIIKIDQTMMTETTYTFLAEHRLINFFLPRTNEMWVHTLKFKVFKRDGVDLKADGNSEMKVKDDQEATMSIEDKKTKTRTVIKVKLQMVKG